MLKPAPKGSMSTRPLLLQLELPCSSPEGVPRANVPEPVAAAADCEAAVPAAGAVMAGVAGDEVGTPAAAAVAFKAPVLATGARGDEVYTRLCCCRGGRAELLYLQLVREVARPTRLELLLPGVLYKATVLVAGPQGDEVLPGVLYKATVIVAGAQGDEVEKLLYLQLVRKVGRPTRLLPPLPGLLCEAAALLQLAPKVMRLTSAAAAVQAVLPRRAARHDCVAIPRASGS